MKKVLILSEYIDPTCNEVVEWLRRWNTQFFRINTEDKISLIYLDVADKKELTLEVNDVVNC